MSTTYIEKDTIAQSTFARSTILPRTRDERLERVNALLRSAREQVDDAVAVLRAGDAPESERRERQERTRTLCADAQRCLIEARDLICADDGTTSPDVVELPH